MEPQRTLAHVETLRATGRNNEALGALRELTRNHPDSAPAWQALGRLFLDHGKVGEAAPCLARAVALEPDAAPPRKFLADALGALGRTDEARAEYERAIALDPNYFQAHANLGNLLEEIDLDAAIRHFQRALQLRPDIAELHDSLGRLLTAKKLGHLARAAFLQALKLKPTLASAHANLAERMYADGQLKPAIERYRQALALAPGFNMARFGLAKTLLAAGEPTEAAALMRELARAPDVPPSYKRFLQAQVMAAQGQPAEALTLFRSLLDESRQDPETLRRLHAEIARVQDSVGDHAAAFASIEAAHAARPRPFDRDEWASRMDRLRALYDGPGFATLPRAGADRPQPIFIFGTPRAGKSLLESLLTTHPGVFGLDEQHAVGHLKLRLRPGAPDLDRDEHERSLDRDELNAMASDYIDIAREYLDDVGRVLGGDVSRLVSATPGNTWKLPLIHRLFPEAPIVHVRRHPLDVCLDCFFKEFAADAHAYSDRLEDLAFFYLHYQRLVSHWRDTLGIPMLEVRYEDMVADPAGTRDRLLDYVGLDRSIPGGLATPVFSADRIGHWRNYEAQLKPLIDRLGTIDPLTFEVSGRPANA